MRSSSDEKPSIPTEDQVHEMSVSERYAYLQYFDYLMLFTQTNIIWIIHCR